MSQRNYQKYFMIYFIVFGTIISFLGAGINYAFQIKEINLDTNKKAKDIYDIKIQTILKSAIENMDETVKSLATNKTVLEYINTNNTHAEEELEQIFMAVVGSQKEIMRARLISKNGKEIIRIDRNKNDDVPFAISKDKLQDKSDRDYFKILSKMNEQLIWHSKMDLNIENGKVEIPYNPVFRTAIPLFNNNEFSGMVIVNMHITNLFSAVGKSSAFEHYIIDKDNNFILHPNDEFSFNKYKNIERNLNVDFPNGLNADGIFSFSIDNVLHNGDKATFILKTKNLYETTLLDSKIYTSFWVALITIILSFILSIYVSRNPVKLQMALLKAHEKLSEFTTIVDNYIITATTKKDSTIINVSSAFVKSSGYSKEELIGEKMHIVRHPDEDENKFKELLQTVSSGKIWDGEIRNKNKNGEDYWLQQHIVPTFDENNNIETLVSLGTDITAKKELEKMASVDKLTNIYNRRMIDNFLKQEVEIEKRHSNGLSVILIDIDHFKDVNYTYGHQMGDMVLSKIAELISINSRKSDIQGRFGGEEFIVICPQTTCKEALVLAQKIRISVENYKFEQIGTKTISLGISAFEKNDTEESLVKKADIALYQAKNGGRNRASLYEKLI